MNFIQKIKFFIIIFIMFNLNSCKFNNLNKYDIKISKNLYYNKGKLPKKIGYYKIGKPYKIANKWYFPNENKKYSKIGKASWYGNNFHGRKTANNEVFDMYALTAAHKTLPLPSLVKVTNLSNNKYIIVRVNDRGPYYKDRIIDLSYAAAIKLNYKNKGLTDVKVEYFAEAAIHPDNDYFIINNLKYKINSFINN